MFLTPVIIETGNSNLGVVADLWPQLAPILNGFTGMDSPPELNHPDLMVVQTAEQSIGIEQAAKFKAWADSSNFSLPVKVGVIVQAEKLTPEAQNNLLKTLEEPVPNTLLVLLVSNSKGLLPTINSRCQALYMVISATDAKQGKYAKMAHDFLAAGPTERVELTQTLVKDSDTQKQMVLDFVGSLAQAANDLEAAAAQRRLQVLKACKQAIIALKSNASPKLTLQTLIITIDRTN